MSEFPCSECGSKKRFHKNGCSLAPGWQKVQEMPYIECPNCNDKTIKLKGDQCITCGALYLGGGKADIRGVKPGLIGNMRPIKMPEQYRVKEVIRTPQDLPVVGEWYVVSMRSLVDFDSEADKQIHVLDLIVAPCLSVEPHGRDYRVTFDMEKTKQFVSRFPGQLFAKVGEVAKVLHGLAESLDGVK